MVIVLIMFIASVAIGATDTDDSKEVQFGDKKFKIPNGLEKRFSEQ